MTAEPRHDDNAEALSLTSLITGILGITCIVPLLGALVAIVTGHLSLRRLRGKPDSRNRTFATIGLILGYLGLPMGAVVGLVWLVPIVMQFVDLPLPPELRTGPAGIQQMQAEMQVRQLALAGRLYAGDWQGAWPADAGVLLAAGYVEAGDLWRVPGSGRQLPATPADLRAGQSDFVYTGAGLDDPAGSERSLTVVFHSKPGLLPGRTIIVAFADGHTETHRADSMAALLAEHPDWRLDADAAATPAEPPAQ